jgi:penicillin-binding protein 1A
MSVKDETLNAGEQPEQQPRPLMLGDAAPSAKGGWWRRGGRDNRPPRPKLRKRRLLFILCGFTVLAVVSMLFGMLTAVASDLGQLDNKIEFKDRVDSELYSQGGRLIGTLAPPNQSVIDRYKQISPRMVNAIVSIEDKGYWHEDGVSLRGIARAFVNDITGGPEEGASTIPEEFVKNVLAQEDNRTIGEKIREAALAFQLVHHWSKQQIMDEYLNTIYFGNGAYGIEAAARTYFGWDHGYNAGDPGAEGKNGCGDPDVSNRHRPSCASELTIAQSALLAGMVANPTAFDPVLNPGAARGRRQQVLQELYEQHDINQQQYNIANDTPLPTAKQIQQPQEPAAAPYFVAWVRPLIIHALEQEGLSAKEAQYQAYYGGLKIKLSLNLSLQNAAQQAVDEEFPKGSNGPTASLVAIDNSNGEVRAMVSGDGDYSSDPFNLAAFGYRQPGSSFKMFTLAAALTSGKYNPDTIIDSKPITIPFRTNGITAHFVVHNFGNVYSGPITLANATATSDNSVFTQVGMSVGTKNVKHFAQLMGIRSQISTTPAMILGGLTTGVSALDMAHAYETAATGGKKVYNPILGDYDRGAIGIASISNCGPCAHHKIVNSPSYQRVLSPEVADEIHELLEGPVHDPSGTGTAANIPGVNVVGKTGTTSNYVDAWFVGWTPQMTVAVWVGYPNSSKEMLHNFNGGPVEGGTFPAIIWRNFQEEALAILDKTSHGATPTGIETTTSATPSGPQTATTPLPTTTSATPTTPTTTPKSTTPVTTTPATTAPATTTPATTTPATTTPAAGGGSTGGGGGL